MIKGFNAMGRNAKEVDWDKVDFLLQAGCQGTEVAAFFKMHPNTFYDKVFEKYNISFTAYQQSENYDGIAKLRAKSYEKSLKGDNHQLSLNLKNRCGYTDKQETKLVGDSDNPLEFFLTQASGKSKDLVNEPSNS